jgi:hypothetical protein
MPGATSAGGGYTCQICGTTFDTEQHLIEHGNEQHPGKAVIWGATDTTSTAATSTEEAIRTEGRSGIEKAKSGMEDIGDKMKASAKAVGSKMKDPDKDLETEYQQKKTEESME